MILAAALLVAPTMPAPVPFRVPVLTVPALAQRHTGLTGRVVRVRGRLAECQPLSCGLLDDQKLAAPIAWLSFERSPGFDRTAQAAVGRIVVVEGMVLGRCWPTPGGRIAAICTDRAPQFRPARILSVLGSVVR